MLNLQQRTNILTRLQKYLTGNDPVWLNTKARAAESNPWFIPPFIENAIQNIALQLLEPSKLETWIASYGIPMETAAPVYRYYHGGQYPTCRIP